MVHLEHCCPPDVSSKVGSNFRTWISPGFVGRQTKQVRKDRYKPRFARQGLGGARYEGSKDDIRFSRQPFGSRDSFSSKHRLS